MLNPASIALGFIALHMIGDYVTQTNGMAANKIARFDAPCSTCDRVHVPSDGGWPAYWWERQFVASWSRTVHVLCYSLPFILLGLLGGLTFPVALLLFAAVYGPHWIIDCRRWASPTPWAPKPIMVDQSLHAAHLAIVFAAFFGSV